MAYRLIGSYGGPKQTFLWRLKKTDAAAAKASLETVLCWGFERITMAHGDVVEAEAKEVLRRACWRLLQ